MGFLFVKLILIYSLFKAMFILHCSSMPLNPPMTRRLEGNETDRLALVAIKAQIQQDPNRATSSWNESLHFCLWHGVTCSRRHSQRVTKLDLRSLKLVGLISPHIGNLSFLRELHLQNNSFSHQIPPQIGNLRRLQVLSLHNNSLSGPIPANISNCLMLYYLQFGRNSLVGEIPSTVSSLTKLQIFVLQHNNLTGKIPTSLGNLSSLEVLVTSSNNLVGGIPSSLGQLKKLSFLSLGDNDLSGTIPSSIYNLSAIVTFSVLLNQLEGSIPSNLSNAFPNLQDYNIASNRFTGAIPLSMSNATSLVRFAVALNNLTGQVPNLQKLRHLTTLSIASNHLGRGEHGDLSFLSDLTNATELFWLFLGYNNFGGMLPASVSNLSAKLECLWLSSNQLHGEIPAGIGNLVNLQSLDMGSNSFTGNIPTDFGKLARLGELRLQNNKFSGRIPSTLGNLTMLITLQLLGNNLNGSIPSSLGKCHRLLELDLAQNNLDGTIPQQLLIGLPLSIYLNFSKNRFSGSLPVEVGKLKALSVLDIFDNMLSGELPNSLGGCESLEALHLQGNFFKGPIPSSMSSLRGIQELDLSRNNLSGKIPQFLASFVFLKNLNLSFNQFWGEVPIKGVFENARATSVVGNVRLCGGIAILRLPTCKSKGGGLSHKMKAMISLVSVFAALGIAMVLSVSFLCSSRTKRKKNTLSNLGDSILQVSFADLFKATGEFCSTNLIGVGGFGSVYKGVLDDGRVVAVKVFNMLHRGASKSFIAECEALRNIRHRNLVKIITACSSIDFHGNDFKALVYEFMDKGSLEEWLHPSTIDEEVKDAAKNLNLLQRLNIALDVACALDYLHNHCEIPIVHCDLKPSNVLLDNELTGRVSDFGLARFLSKLTSNVTADQSSSIGIRGSVGYAAPEYGIGSEVSTYGDVYSFGILLLEMFTGKRPTDHMFSDGLNLHSFVKTVSPERVVEITDAGLLQGGKKDGQKNVECLVLIFETGIACSTGVPRDRMSISDVVSKLHSIRDHLLA